MASDWLKAQLPSSISLLFNSVRQKNKASLDRIPNDVLVDVVFDYLDVPDIISLRQVRVQ
jgi:hypothetical protein